MSMRFVNGSFIDAKENILVHQVNCVGEMAEGVSEQIKERYPDVYSEYRVMCITQDRRKLLNSVLICKVDENKYVANIFGQLSYGWGGKHTNLIALETGLKKVAEYAQNYHLSVAIPYMLGCEGGASWSEVERIVARVFAGVDTCLYIQANN